MKQETKLSIHNGIINPTLLQACEDQTIKKKCAGKIAAMEMKHLRRIAEKTKWDRLTERSEK